MADRTYFLVNDTRYDNHHGGLTVVRNLHAAMSARGWYCTGALPVSATVDRLAGIRRAIHDAQLILVNGEGSLHHNRRNARRLLDICERLQTTHPVAIVNALWQDNDTRRWQPVLAECKAIYTRDRRSQTQLAKLGLAPGYAPDLTFYDYPRISIPVSDRMACTDSVKSDWTAWALGQCEEGMDMDFITLFTRTRSHTRGRRDIGKQIKYALYPVLQRRLQIRPPARYRALGYAVDDTTALLQRIASARAICVARYHALCFALQQNRPFVAVPSNSHKSEALLAEVGLLDDRHMYHEMDGASLRAALDRVAARHDEVQPSIAAFNRSARARIDAMFDALTDSRDESR